MPSTRSLYKYRPLPNAAEKDTRFENPRHEGVVLIEWRSERAESKPEISNEALARRRGHIARLLHRTATSDDDYRILNCLGFYLAVGRLPNGETHPIVGFVCQLPPNASSRMELVSLRTILGQSFISEKPRIPDLDDRYLLARSLAISLYQLHCAAWINRKISSYNILFFEDKESGRINITQPYLCGWQYARPDSRASGYTRRQWDTEMSTISIGDLDMYVHLDRFNLAKGVPRFRKSYDLYSLGIVLTEIAFWEPIVAFASVESRIDIEKFEIIQKYSGWSPSSIKAAVEKEVGSEMGVAYRNAVLICLGGFTNANRENKAIEADDMKDMEVGIEREFF